jgi:HK97 family phage major capsid protein
MIEASRPTSCAWSRLTVVAGYGPELAEQTDASPTLAQPTANTQRGSAFVPYSVEVGMDYPGLEAELGKLLSDARDVVDSTKFLSGTGVNEPVGIFAASGGLTTSQRVQSATGSTLAVGDTYLLREGLAATRFFANATFVGHPTVWDTIFRFVGGGNTVEPMPFTMGRGGPFLGTPVASWNAMSTAVTTTGAKVLLLADFSGYTIADRIGSQIELIPHLFGAANRYPIGARGLFFWWRTGTVVSKPNACRYLEIR